jgi:hypothetical protein
MNPRLLGAYIGLVKTAAKWDKLWRAGKLGEGSLQRIQQKAGPHISEFLEGRSLHESPLIKSLSDIAPHYKSYLAPKGRNMSRALWEK